MFTIPLPVTVISVATVAAAVTDLRGFRISNSLTLILLPAGLAYHAVTGGIAGLAASGLGVLAGLAVTLPGHRLGGMGAGDVKLMAGVGAWLGALLTLAVFLAAALATGVYALALVVLGGRYRKTWANLGALVRGETPGEEVAEAVRHRDRLRVVPFGAMVGIGLATLIALAWWWRGF